MNYLLENNYNYSKTLCEWALNNNTKFIYASSASVYGDGDQGFSDEDILIDKLKPLNPYAYSKWMFDNWVIKNHLSDKVTGFRFFNVFGPNEYHKENMCSVIYRYFETAKKDGKFTLFKSYNSDYVDGGQVRDFIYIKDLVDVIFYALTNKDITGIYNLGTGKARSFNDLASAVLTALKKPVKIEYFEMPLELRDKYQYFTEADISKLQAKGYTKKFMELEDSINDYVNNYLINKTYY